MKSKSNNEIQPIVTNQPFEDNIDSVVEKDPLAYYPSNKQKNTPYFMSYQKANALIPEFNGGYDNQNNSIEELPIVNNQSFINYNNEIGDSKKDKKTKKNKKNKKNKKPMKKGKKIALTILVTVLILAVLGGGVFVLWMFVFNKADKMFVNFDNVKVNMADEFYLGNRSYKNGKENNTFDLNQFFEEGTREFAISEADGKASLSGSTITITEIGNFKLTVTESKEDPIEYKVIVVDAVNVLSMVEMRKAIDAEINVVLQKDLKSDVDAITLKSNVYGNGHNLVIRDANVVGADLGVYFDVKEENVIIQDLQLTGRKLNENELEQFKLEEFDHYGYLISVSGDEDQKFSLLIKNCVLENAERLVFSRHADIKIEGSILQNAADACVSIETHPVGKSNITVKNCVIRNALVAGILCWGFTEGVTEETANNIYIEGFVDIYNFKERQNVQIVPRKEAISGLANTAISTEIKRKTYDSYFYNYNEKEYIHFGIVIMCSGSVKKNISKLYDNGVFVDSDTKPSAKIGYVKRPLPTGPVANLGLKQCDVYGYDQKPFFNPDDAVKKNIFDELRNGRK